MYQWYNCRTWFFFFNNNPVFDNIFCEGKSKSWLLFEVVLKIHQVKMKVVSILHIIHITGTVMIVASIDGIYRRNKFREEGGGVEYE